MGGQGRGVRFPLGNITFRYVISIPAAEDLPSSSKSLIFLPQRVPKPIDTQCFWKKPGNHSAPWWLCNAILGAQRFISYLFIYFASIYHHQLSANCQEDPLSEPWHHHSPFVFLLCPSVQWGGSKEIQWNAKGRKSALLCAARSAQSSLACFCFPFPAAGTAGSSFPLKIQVINVSQHFQEIKALHWWGGCLGYQASDINIAAVWGVDASRGL